MPECIICCESFVTHVTPGCSHTFCEKCLSKWKSQSVEIDDEEFIGVQLNSTDKCPLCRHKFKQLIYVVADDELTGGEISCEQNLTMPKTTVKMETLEDRNELASQPTSQEQLSENLEFQGQFIGPPSAYRCEICGRDNFATTAAKFSHKETHNIGSYVCSCGLAYNNRSSYRRHCRLKQHRYRPY